MPLSGDSTRFFEPREYLVTRFRHGVSPHREETGQLFPIHLTLRFRQSLNKKIAGQKKYGVLTMFENLHTPHFLVQLLYILVRRLNSKHRSHAHWKSGKIPLDEVTCSVQDMWERYFLFELKKKVLDVPKEENTQPQNTNLTKHSK